jgi:cyclic pyranopterin phosphate synthase
VADENKLTHFDADGKAIMVEVGEKTPSRRVAVARGEVRMQETTLSRILDRRVEKGDVFAIARIAGIMAAKKTPELIPLCHPLLLTSVALEFTPFPGEGRVEIEATVKLTGTTGVEMEALTAVSVAALTIYDMCKAVDKAMVLGAIRLEEKQGGKSGVYKRPQSLTPQQVGSGDA